MVLNFNNNSLKFVNLFVFFNINNNKIKFGLKIIVKLFNIINYIKLNDVFIRLINNFIFNFKFKLINNKGLINEKN